MVGGDVDEQSGYKTLTGCTHPDISCSSIKVL